MVRRPISFPSVNGFAKVDLDAPMTAEPATAKKHFLASLIEPEHRSHRHNLQAAGVYLPARSEEGLKLCLPASVSALVPFAAADIVAHRELATGSLGAVTGVPLSSSAANLIPT